VITLAWTIYFVLLAIVANGRADAHVRTACFFALVGLVGYRLDEARQRGVSAQARARRRRRLDCGRDLFPLAGRRVGATSQRYPHDTGAEGKIAQRFQCR